MRFLVLIGFMASLASADALPTQREVKEYLDARVTTECAGKLEASGHLAGALRLSCRTHRAEPDHDWHVCANALVTAWCATH